MNVKLIGPQNFVSRKKPGILLIMNNYPAVNYKLQYPKPDFDVSKTNKSFILRSRHQPNQQHAQMNWCNPFI